MAAFSPDPKAPPPPPPPLLDLRLDRKVYRPGDAVVATVEICNPTDLILVEQLAVDVRGTEKLDPQWIVTPKPAGSKHKRGERIFMESCGQFVRGAFVEGSVAKSYLVRVVLPKILPPSFRGTAVRYFYHLTATIRWKYVAAENGSSSKQASLPLEKRVPITVWTMPNNSGLANDLSESNENGIVPLSLLEVEMQWKENSPYSEWTRTANVLSGVDDDVSSQGSESVSQSPRGTLENRFDQLLLQSSVSTPKYHPKPGEQEDDSKSDASSLGYVKGKAYNIRLGDQVLVRISPKNPDAVHYFGDTIAGVVSFSDEGSTRKCLEVSVVLEIHEVLNPSHLHPSRRNSQVISKVQSEYHEVVADVSQTHFLFSIPLDGPASFSTPHVTVQWVLRFEFVATAANADWATRKNKCEHPLETSPLETRERETGEWTLPITVHAPLPRVHGARKDRPVASLRDFWLQSPKASDWVGSPILAAGPSNGHL